VCVYVCHFLYHMMYKYPGSGLTCVCVGGRIRERARVCGCVYMCVSLSVSHDVQISWIRSHLCVREGERECVCVCVHVCVCVWHLLYDMMCKYPGLGLTFVCVREREREFVCLCVCVRVCM